jgi:hypothetical protein
MRDIMKETYLFGIIMSILAFVIFGVLGYHIIGWWTLLVSPLVSLGALRPAGNDKNHCWMWERMRGS